MTADDATSTVTQTVNLSLPSWLLASASGSASTSSSSSADPNATQRFVTQALLVANGVVQSLIRVQEDVRRQRRSRHGEFANFGFGGSSCDDSTHWCIDAEDVKAANFIVKIVLRGPQQWDKLASSSSAAAAATPSPSRPGDCRSIRQGNRTLHDNDDDGDNDDCTPLERLYRGIDLTYYSQPPKRALPPEDAIEPCMGFFSRWIPQNPSPDEVATTQAQTQAHAQTESSQPQTAANVSTERREEEANVLRHLREMGPDRLGEGFAGVEYVGPVRDATTAAETSHNEPRSNRHWLHRLGRIFYFLFSGGGPLPPSLSTDEEDDHDDSLFGGWLEGALASIDSSEDTAPGDGRDDPSLLRKGKQRRRAGHGKNDIDDDDTNVYRLLHGQKRIPRSICRLVYDLWKSDSQNDASIDPEEAFTSLEEVSTELLSMMAQPHIFLRDDEPQNSLTWDDTKLYGRAKEVERLLDAMAGASTNRQTLIAEESKGELHRNHLVLVAGCSGSGKSSLVSSTVSAVTELGWMVLESKFEDRSARHPLSVMMAAFEGYFASVWEEEEENAPYRQHVERSLQALIPLTEVPFLAKLVPSIARFFTAGHSYNNDDSNSINNTYDNNYNYDSNSNSYYGDNSSPAHDDYDQRGSSDSDMGVSSSEHQMNRLCCLFQLIIHAMNSGGRPLLIFMDDLQYADPSAIELFESFLFNSKDFARNIQSLGSNAPVFVGTYRDNEVNDTNNLLSFLSTMRESSYCVRLTEIQLENLPLEAVNEMISETLRLPKRVTKTLAEVTVSKTDGNPLFLRSFLNSMVEEGNIRYSLVKRRWTWDTLALSESAIGDDVAALLARKLLRLPASVQMALRTASCFGMRVEEWMIKDPDMLVCLDRAVDQGLVERFGSTLTFVHSSVHSAAYNLLPENERKAAHMNLGLEIIFNQRNTSKVVCSKSSVADNLSNSMVITAIDQINRCRPLTISDPALLRIFSEMNLRAGNECVDMSDFLSAQKYFLAGKEFMRIDNWQSDYDLMLSLANGLCITSYVNGDSLTLLACAKEVVQHAQKSVQDKLVAYSMHIKLLVSQGCQAEAIDSVLRGLHELGETFPQSDSNMSDLDAAKDVFFSTKKVLEDAGTEAFELCPQLVDKRKMWAMKLMVTAFKNIMQSNLAYTVLISCRMIAITLNYGSCDRSAFGLVAFAIASLSLIDDFEFSHRWGRAGIQLLQQEKKNGDHNFSTRVNNFFTMFLSAPADPFQATQDVLYTTYKTSMRKGDVDTAAEAATFYFHLGAMTGMKLSLLDSKFVEFSTTMSRKKQKHQLLILSIINSFVLGFLGVGRNVRECTTGSTTNQNERLEHALKHKKLLVVRMIYFYNMQECFWKRDFENAYNFAEKHTCTKGPGLLKGIMVFFYKGLMAFYFARSKGERKWIDEGLKSVSALKSWCKRYNWNYENKYFILLAEYYNSVDDVKNSMDYYVKAIQSARNHRFPHEEGLSLELFGYFHLRLGDVCRGRELIRESCIPYNRWGGITKVKLLESFLSSDSCSILIH